jgi:hypothetical protein
MQARSACSRRFTRAGPPRGQEQDWSERGPTTRCGTHDYSANWPALAVLEAALNPARRPSEDERGPTSRPAFEQSDWRSAAAPVARGVWLAQSDEPVV